MGGVGMTAGERAELTRAVRLRAKVATADVAAHRARLMAEFEEEMSARYQANDDRWRDITEEAEKAVQRAQEAIAAACEQAGIQPEFAPGLSLQWYGRGENAVAKRRAELRSAAIARLDAAEKAAKATVERSSAELQIAITADGLTSGGARAWLDKIPQPEDLLGSLSLAAIEAAVTERRSLHP